MQADNKNKRIADESEFMENKLKKLIDEQIIAPKYKCKANEVIHFRIVSSVDDLTPPSKKTHVFHPEYTYDISNEEDEIIGYENLKVTIDFMAATLYPLVTINYDSKAEYAEDLLLKFDQIFEDGIFTLNEKDTYEDLFEKEEKEFVPFGKLAHEFSENSKNYQIFLCDFETPGFKKYHLRMQPFVKFYINGGTYIDPDVHWIYYILYQFDKSTKKYSLISFCSVYKFHRALNLHRRRISQFVTLPPFQRQGLGSILYEQIYKDVLSDPECFQLTVEDSSIQFQSLRDFMDVKLLLREEGDWLRKEIKEKGSGSGEKEIGKKWKIIKNQVRRAVELIKLCSIQDENNFQLFKKEVKSRLEEANKEEFFPFQNKKIPYVVFDGQQAIINPSIYKSASTSEIESRLEEYFNEIMDDYEILKPKIKSLLNAFNFKFAN